MIDKIIYILPTLIIVESFLAVIPLALNRQWGTATYWFAAGLINFSAMFLIKRFG